MMNPTSDDLTAITASTLAHYESSADEYAERTADHDVSQNIATLLRHLEGPGPFTLLDFGCGPGRDLRTMAATGHIAVGLDGSAAFVRMARESTGCEVLHQDFLALDLPASRFDGIFANASMQHVPSRALPRVLRQLRAALKPRAVLLASIPHGDNEEGWNGARYSAFHDLPTWRGYLSDAGFEELEHYYRPTGKPRDEQRWLASAWRRV
jgi:SAM-dependent methyltransferase